MGLEAPSRRCFLLPHTHAAQSLLLESIRSGTIASLVIVPLSPLFKAAGLRIGHYGPKFAALFFDNLQPWLLFAQHLVIGCQGTRGG